MSTTETTIAVLVQCPACGHGLPFLPAGVTGQVALAVLSHPRRHPGTKDHSREHNCAALVEVKPSPAGGFVGRVL